MIKTLSNVDATNKQDLQRYEDCLRHRLKKFGYKVIKRKTIQPKFDSTSKVRGFRIIEIGTDNVVGGENYDLSLKDIETFWFSIYKEQNADKEAEKLKKWLKKNNAVQLDGGWIVTNDARALKTLEDHILKYGSFDDDGYGTGGDIASVMYKAYRPWCCPEFSQVWPADGDRRNLTDTNLKSDADETALPSDMIPITTQRRVWHNKHRIFIKLPAYKQLFFTTYTAEMFDILCNTALLKSWAIIKNRLYCRVCGKIIAFADVVSLFDSGKIDMADITGSILSGKHWMQENKLETDHLRNNTGNNCPHSIAIMPKSRNSSKNTMLIKIMTPYSFVAVRVGEDFRILLGRFGMPDEYSRYIMCHGADQFLECLQKFYKIAKDSGEMLPVPENPDMTRCISQMLQDDGEEYHEGQYNPIEGLLRAEDTEFTLWNGDVSLLKSIKNKRSRKIAP